MRNLLKLFLKLLAKQVIRRYRPIVIGITGSVGKTTAKEAIYAVLSRNFWVRRNEENFNNEFGVPYAVLGIEPKSFKAISHKLSAISSALWLACGPRQKYPRLLVLELAADRPGDIGYLTDIVQPTVGVVTAVGEVPVHVEFYTSPKQVAKEKAKLIQVLPRTGLAVLNRDDPTVLEMRALAKSKVVTFGLTPGADLWVSEINYFIADQKELIGGLSFKIHQGESFVPMHLTNLIAPHQLYGVLAAAAVGLHYGLTLVDISHALEYLHPPPGRMNLLRGIRGSIIIDDTYNASPASTGAALETLAGFATAAGKLATQPIRRVAVLGDMRELGKYSDAAHRQIGALAGQHCDRLVTVGPAAQLIADTAASRLGPDQVQSFLTASEAISAVRQLVQSGDIILVKGSQSTRMEKIVEQIMMDADRKADLLARQYGKWLVK